MHGLEPIEVHEEILNWAINLQQAITKINWEFGGRPVMELWGDLREVTLLKFIEGCVFESVVLPRLSESS